MDRKPNSPVLHSFSVDHSTAQRINAYPLLSKSHLGLAIPDLVKVSIFADGPSAAGAMSQSADFYFRKLPWVSRCDDDPLTGKSYTWREGDILFTLGTKTSFTLTASFNLQRMVASRHGLIGAKEDDGNTIYPLLSEGYNLKELRTGMCADIVDTVMHLKKRYVELFQDVFRQAIEGDVHANFSRVELDYDFSGNQNIIDSYSRSFGKVIGIGANSTGLSGRLRKGESFAIYLKRPQHSSSHIIRIEMAIGGPMIKKLVGGQRVPNDAQAVGRILDAIEAYYLPIWIEVERHRQPGKVMRNGQFNLKIPRPRGARWMKLQRAVRQLAKKGRIRVVKSNRSLVLSLEKNGLLENLRRKTRVRGYRVTSPSSDPHWQAWGMRPGEALG
jgi:hypothetical protein